MKNECDWCCEPIEKDSECFQINVVNLTGKKELVTTCSVRCANLFKNSNATFHQKRTDEIRFQNIQKIIVMTILVF